MDAHTDPVVLELLERTNRAQVAFMNGDPAPYQALFAGAPEASLIGPFGGDHLVGVEMIKAAVARASGMIASGTSAITLIRAEKTDDVVVLVMLERSRATFKTAAGVRNWTLRVTQIYRRFGADWRVVHRHADPLSTRRTLEETLALLPS